MFLLTLIIVPSLYMALANYKDRREARRRTSSEVKSRNV